MRFLHCLSGPQLVILEGERDIIGLLQVADEALITLFLQVLPCADFTEFMKRPFQRLTLEVL